LSLSHGRLILRIKLLHNERKQKLHPNIATRTSSDSTSLLERHQTSMILEQEVPKSLEDKSAQNNDPSIAPVPRLLCIEDGMEEAFVAEMARFCRWISCQEQLFSLANRSSFD
ncbi:hypothetical protein KCU73_g55, partial [Aureobasidium melanogenum]